jgi:hypothetical protein
MIRLISYFALFTLCNSFRGAQWLNKMKTYSERAMNLSKNFIPVISSVKKPLEPGWYDGEIPWDIEDDNYTSVRMSPSKPPITPLKFEEQHAFKYRFVC